jgi:phage-related protein
MQEIQFYRTIAGSCPIEDFFDKLSDKQVEKVLWVLRIIRDVDFIPKEYFKKLINTDDIWEIRVKFGNNIFRILGFFYQNKIIILTNGFIKKSQKTPMKEIKIAQDRKKEYLERNI